METNPLTETNLTLFLVDGFAALIAIVVLSGLIVRASRYSGSARFIGPLAILSGVAMVLGTFAEADALIAIGAGGVGALGAVLQSVMKKDEEE